MPPNFYIEDFKVTAVIAIGSILIMSFTIFTKGQAIMKILND